MALVLPSVIMAGWIMTFFTFFQEHFLKNAVSHHPLMLLLDGHGTHCDLTSLKFARKALQYFACLHTQHMRNNL